MEKIEQLLKEIEKIPYCRVFESSGLPSIDKTKHILPDDLKNFIVFVVE